MPILIFQQVSFEDVSGTTLTRAEPLPNTSELVAVIQNLIGTTDALSKFLHAQYPDEQLHMFRRAQYDAQHALGNARDLLQRVAAQHK